MINPEHILITRRVGLADAAVHVMAQLDIGVTKSFALGNPATREEQDQFATYALWSHVYGDILTTVTEILAMDSEQAKTKALRRLEEKLRTPGDSQSQPGFVK